jgi:diamine N-acetyltransferase
MNLKELHLRALEPEDLTVLEQVENDTVNWNYCNQTEPFSLFTLKQYINQQSQDIFEVRQKRFVISDMQKKCVGFCRSF